MAQKTRQLRNDPHPSETLRHADTQQIAGFFAGLADGPLRVVEVADDLFAPGVELGAFGGHRRTAGGVVEQPDRKFFLETGQRGADRSSRHAQLARRAAPLKVPESTTFRNTMMPCRFSRKDEGPDC